MAAPLITVLINTHNYGHFIEEAIDSVLSQDFPLDQLEILVVDDGSTDDTPERVKKYGSRVRYFYKPNGGQASALNSGIARACGEIVALLDADDLFLPGKLARVAEAFQRNPALGMVYHRYLEWNVQTNLRRDSDFRLVSGDARTAPDEFLNYIPHPTSCISLRRTALDPLLPIPEGIRMLADCYLVQLIPLLSPILAVPESLVVYRIHGRNHFSADERQISPDARKERLQQWRVLYNAMRGWLADNGYTRKQLPVRFFRDSWYLYEQREGFLIKPPGRLRFFWYLVRENHAHSSRQTWKLTAFQYVTTLSAFISAYDNWHQTYEWRFRAVKKATRLVRGVFRAHSSSNSR